MHPWIGLPDGVRLGVLNEWVTAGLVDEVLAECGKRDQEPGALPARFMVCYVLALALFQQDSYDDVAENLAGALEGMDEAIPDKSSFTRARQRLGAGVIEAVFRRLAGPVAPAGLDGAFWRGMRVAAVDGFVLDVPDTPANRAAFGGPADAKGQPAGFPQARVVTLTETGTHSLIDASVGGFRAGEPELAIAMAGSAAGMRWPVGPGRVHQAPVVGSQLGIRAVDLRVIQVRAVHPGLEVVRHEPRRDPEKNCQASSHPAMTSSSVIENVRYTNMYREKQAVNTSARNLRRLPSPAGISPRSPKSICSSPPGGPSSTRVVTLLPAPHRSAANRCSVRSATITPCRASKTPIFTTGTPPSTHPAICSRRASSSAQPWPCASGRTGRTTDTTCPTSSSVSCSSPPSRDNPAATAAAT